MPAKNKTKGKAKTKTSEPATPSNGPLEMASPQPLPEHTTDHRPFQRHRGDPHLAPARLAFQRSQAKIEAPQESNRFKTAPSAVVAFAQHTIYSQLLKEHQDEILRFSEELAAAKQEATELKKKLVAAGGAATMVGKRKRLGGRLFDEAEGEE